MQKYKRYMLETGRMAPLVRGTLLTGVFCRYPDPGPDWTMKGRYGQNHSLARQRYWMWMDRAAAIRNMRKRGRTNAQVMWGRIALNYAREARKSNHWVRLP